MFIDQFIIVNNTEVKHFKCVPMPTTITDLFRPLQTPSISNSLIAKEILLLHKLKCIKKIWSSCFISKTSQNQSAHIYIPQSGRILKPHSLCVSQLLLLFCYCAKTDTSLPLQIAHILFIL